MPVPHYVAIFYSPSFSKLSKTFAGIAVTTTFFTVAACFHEKPSTEYVRVKLYILLSGPAGNTTWRNTCGLVTALLCHALHFLVGVLSLPVAITCVVTNELTMETYPDAERSTYDGQWGPWVGAVLIFMAVAVNQSSLVENVGTSLEGALLAPIRRFFPTCCQSAGAGGHTHQERCVSREYFSQDAEGNQVRYKILA